MSHTLQTVTPISLSSESRSICLAQPHPVTATAIPVRLGVLTESIFSRRVCFRVGAAAHCFMGVNTMSLLADNGIIQSQPMLPPLNLTSSALEPAPAELLNDAGYTTITIAQLVGWLDGVFPEFAGPIGIIANEAGRLEVYDIRRNVPLYLGYDLAQAALTYNKAIIADEFEALSCGHDPFTDCTCGNSCHIIEPLASGATNCLLAAEQDSIERDGVSGFDEFENPDTYDLAEACEWDGEVQ